MINPEAHSSMSCTCGRHDLRHLSSLQVASRGVPAAEVNLDTSGATNVCQYVFQASFTIL